MATHISLNVGGTLVLARKFSVTNFWDDVYNNKVTINFVSSLWLLARLMLCLFCVRARLYVCKVILVILADISRFVIIYLCSILVNYADT